MDKIKKFTSDENEEIIRYAFYCPGCESIHIPTVKTNQQNEPCWIFNWNTEKPTFTPSILVFANNPEVRCHSFVTDGKIQFLVDCYHKLKNQTVDLPDWDDIYF